MEILASRMLFRPADYERSVRFYRDDIGLAIARDLTRLNGGELRHVVDAPQGATFRVYLPSTAAPIRGHW